MKHVWQQNGFIFISPSLCGTNNCSFVFGKGLTWKQECEIHSQLNLSVHHRFQHCGLKIKKRSQYPLILLI